MSLGAKVPAVTGIGHVRVAIKEQAIRSRGKQGGMKGLMKLKQRNESE